MPYRTFDHGQMRLEDLGIECDGHIAHVISALNRIDGVRTTSSCWNITNDGGGYVDVKAGCEAFIDYLEETLDPDVFWVDRAPSMGLTSIKIYPGYEDGMKRRERNSLLYEKWDELLRVSLGFEGS